MQENPRGRSSEPTKKRETYFVLDANIQQTDTIPRGIKIKEPVLDVKHLRGRGQLNNIIDYLRVTRAVPNDST